MANDHFAEIADRYAVDKSRELITPQPPELPELPIQLKNNRQGVFDPPQKMDSKEELDKALNQLRTQMEPFLKNYAPKLLDQTPHIDIKEFDWSIDGEPIQRVTIPHYGAKTGKHCAEYTTDFILPEFNQQLKRVIMTFKGVDYIAEVFLNGAFVGRHEGFFAPFELDVSVNAHPGQNQLRILVKNDFNMEGNFDINGQFADGDKIYASTGPGWDDSEEGWHHCPPGMGIYQPVYVELREREYITDVFVREGRELWVECMGTDIQEKMVSFEVSIYGQNFKQTVMEGIRIEPTTGIEAGIGDTLTESRLSAEGKLKKKTPLRLGNGFNRFQIPISIPDARIWSTDCPNLYQVQVRMIVDGRVCSVRARQFGIRTFIQDVKSNPKGMFFLNGKPLRLHGANTMGFEQQCVMQENWAQLLDDMLLAKLCNMNFLRLTQRPVQEEIYELCDQIGLMIQTDLPLFGTVRINQMAETIRQAGEMEHLIRSHPCCVLVTYINEPYPDANNKPHRMIKRGDLMRLFDAADAMVHLHNPDRVIKHVDGDYDPPSDTLPDNHCYTMWYNGHAIDLGKLHKGYWLEVKPGWYWGCGEFGAEGLDFAELMCQRYPKEWLREPFDPTNIKMSQTANFHYFFYDTPNSMSEWVEASQDYQAFATKIMTNAFRRSNGMVTFAIHLFIDAWPSGWMKAIVDCRRIPKPAFFAYRDCLSPIKADLRCDRFAAFGGETLQVESRICNDGDSLEGAEVYYMAQMDGKTIASKRQPAVIGCCCTEYQGMVQLQLPTVMQRCHIMLFMGIVHNGKVLHWTSEQFTVFPKKKFCIPKTITYADYDTHRAEYQERLNASETIIFEPLEPGVYSVAGQTIRVRACGMSPVYFVSATNGHPLTQGFEKGDFSYWYDSEVKRLVPIAKATLDTGYGDTVLSSGNLDNHNEWRKADVCTVLSAGKGKVVFCQINLQYANSNPACAEFADRLTRL